MQTTTSWARAGHCSLLSGAAGAVVAGLILLAPPRGESIAPHEPAAEPQEEYAAVQPLLKKYCLDCHSTKAKKGGLDLERFASLDQVRKDLKPWQQMIEMLEAGEMPPKGKPQPTAEERKRLLAWVRGFLDAEARARAGDPGPRPAPPAQQRRVRLHDPRPDRRGSAADPRVPRGRGGRRRLHQRRRGALGHLARRCSTSTSTRPRTSPTTPCCCPTASASRRPRRAATGPTRASPGCASSTPATSARRPAAAPAVPGGHRPPSRRAARRQDRRWKRSRRRRSSTRNTSASCGGP